MRNPKAVMSRPCSSPSQAIRGWKGILRHYAVNGRRDAEDQLAWFRSQPTLAAAISEAALARDQRGKRYSHQTRIPSKSLAAGNRALSKRSRVIRSAKDFAALFRIVSTATFGIPRLGELWRYDTALRIGSWLDVLPERVYLHSGTRVGARNLGLIAKAESVTRGELPKELRNLPAYEIEDILCIYKDHLRRRIAR